MYAPSNDLTATERSTFVRTLLSLYRNEHIRPAAHEARRLADYLNSAFETNPSMLYNEFELNRLVLALKAIALAADEIDRWRRRELRLPGRRLRTR